MSKSAPLLSQKSSQAPSPPKKTSIGPVAFFASQWASEKSTLCSKEAGAASAPVSGVNLNQSSVVFFQII